MNGQSVRHTGKLLNVPGGLRHSGVQHRQLINTATSTTVDNKMPHLGKLEKSVVDENDV
jgi:hypothetical protein